ncbi:MAG: sigma-70 family RNA polymerase sigma factor [Bryobacterales bacterium]|nr:sigma-70 family RNA polymerase sigma factor [Bryobacterales bacterium]
MGDVTVLLSRWCSGDRGALDALTPLVYEELRAIAEHYLGKERSNHTLAPTALVHEAWLKLVRQDQSEFPNRKHFYALAARVMRNILVDHARALQTGKRGGGQMTIAFGEAQFTQTQHANQFLVLNDAMDRLAKMSPRQAQVIELRYFAGLNLEEISELTGVSQSTISRDQRAAEAWLGQAMQEGVR